MAILPHPISLIMHRFAWILLLQPFLALSFAPIPPYNLPRAASTSLAAAVTSGDTVLVVGGTGGVGQLVTKKLVARGDLTVKATSRNAQKGAEILDDPAIQVVELDLVNGSDESLAAALEGVSALVISVGTTAFPTARWKGGNTPKAIDDEAVTRIAKAAPSSVKRIVLLTSVGVNRTGEMPFLILNLFGVLDAKRSGEDAIKAAAGGFDYAIVRPGRLVGGPFTNLDIAKLLQVEGGAENGLDLQAGDSLLGDCKRDACAEAVVQGLVNDACSNVEFSVISNEQPALTGDQWTEAFQTL